MQGGASGVVVAGLGSWAQGSGSQGLRVQSSGYGVAGFAPRGHGLPSRIRVSGLVLQGYSLLSRDGARL